MRCDIKDSIGARVGWFETDWTGNNVNYYGVTKGLIGRYEKTTGWWFWLQGPKSGQRGPQGDIGYSEVLKAEGKI